MLRILPCFLCLVAAPALAAPPSLSSVETVLGPKLYRDGDVIEIGDRTGQHGAYCFPTLFACEVLADRLDEA